MNAIVFDNLLVSFAHRTILDRVNLQIQDKQFIALLGANGAGKTTLLRTLLGLVPVRSGSVTVRGAPAGTDNRNIGYVPQTRNLLNTARLCGWDFVASALHGDRWGLPLISKASRKEIDWALATVGAGELAKRPLMETSGGERQRLLLAQALLGRPKLLLLDEPLISLDPHHQNKTIQLVKAVQQELGITVLFSAHEINPLMGAVDQVLYLGKGQAALGTVDAVITSEVLSRLYGTAIEVLRHQGRIFVMAGATEVEKMEHSHDA